MKCLVTWKCEQHAKQNVARFRCTEARLEKRLVIQRYGSINNMRSEASHERKVARFCLEEGRTTCSRKHLMTVMQLSTKHYADPSLDAKRITWFHRPAHMSLLAQTVRALSANKHHSSQIRNTPSRPTYNLPQGFNTHSCTTILGRQASYLP
ncbi:hypothetical protein AMTR_s00070p00180160 [Amborella trichopoda]|uniref:Uncharacterized protein n=1 Tax=Amborella trichopoda TaxID=13333 RepID=U5DGQ5_AMBTC|nr:hypothetical protein AMTR_s00070p00180160 [Amborella trichopoda]